VHYGLTEFWNLFRFLEKRVAHEMFAGWWPFGTGCKYCDWLVAGGLGSGIGQASDIGRPML
jgi:hypothetical protein